MNEQEKTEVLVEKLRVLITGVEASWILFDHGTCVMLKESESDLQEQAKEILKKWGPVVPGTDLGDFNVIKLDKDPGWVVTYSHPFVFNYISPDELAVDESSDPIERDVVIGCLGREKRKQDANSLNIIHIEDKRS